MNQNVCPKCNGNIDDCGCFLSGMNEVDDYEKWSRDAVDPNNQHEIDIPLEMKYADFRREDNGADRFMNMLSEYTGYHRDWIAGVFSHAYEMLEKYGSFYTRRLIHAIEIQHLAEFPLE